MAHLCRTSWSRSDGTNVYFDSSALVKLLVLGEPESDLAAELFREADRRSTSVRAYAECRAALAAAMRARRLKPADTRKAVITPDEVWQTLDRNTDHYRVVQAAAQLAEPRGIR